MITLTENAISKLRDVIAEENNPALKLRVLEQSDDDFDLEFSGVNLLIDSMSSGYLQGAEIDYREDQYGSAFSIKNPQAATTCGCGSSFSPG